MRPFEPHRGTNQVVTPGAASASVSLDPTNRSVRVLNIGANICHVRIGKGAQTATTADAPISPGTAPVFSKAEGEDTLAYISAAGTVLHIQTGDGGV